MQTLNAATLARVPAAIALRGTANFPRSASASAAQGKLRLVARGEELFAEGDPADYFYKVVAGTVRTCKVLSDGRRQIEAFHLEGDLFGFESGATHRFSAEAIDDVEVLAFRHRHLSALAQENPELGDQIMTATLASLDRANDHMVLLGRKTAQEKIASFLLDMAHRLARTDRFDLPMQRADIADHLGLTIETVSRTLTQMARQGLIKLSTVGRTVVLSDKVGLQRINA